MLLSANSIRRLKPIFPIEEKTVVNGKSFGLSYAGYDIRCAEEVFLGPGHFSLASTIEQFDLPRNVVGLVKDKSSWARLGLSVFNTVIEPGWRGFLTLELVNHSMKDLLIHKGDPIAQVLFEYVDEKTDGYTGKYQGQGPGPQEAIYERS